MRRVYDLLGKQHVQSSPKLIHRLDYPSVREFARQSWDDYYFPECTFERHMCIVAVQLPFANTTVELPLLDKISWQPVAAYNTATPGEVIVFGR